VVRSGITTGTGALVGSGAIAGRGSGDTGGGWTTDITCEVGATAPDRGPFVPPIATVVLVLSELATVRSTEVE
jgi:hypothetical protein